MRDIADAIESQSNEGAAYVNPETGEIVQVSEDELALVEETKTFRSGNARRCPRYLRPWKVPAFSPCRTAGNEKLAKYSSSRLEQHRLVETGEGTTIALGLAIAPLGTYVAELAGADLEKLKHVFSLQAMIHTYAKLIPLTLQAFAELNDKLERDIEEQENEAEY